MSKPLDVILVARAEQREQNAIDQDALQLLDAAGRLADQWTALMAEAAILCSRRGLTTLLARAAALKGEDAAAAMQTLLTAAAAFQAAVTDLPMPEFPLEPVSDTPSPEAAE